VHRLRDTVVELIAHDNLINSLPNNMGLLSKLTTLDLSHNCLDKLPPSMDKLKRLKYDNHSQAPVTQTCVQSYITEICRPPWQLSVPSVRHVAYHAHITIRHSSCAPILSPASVARRQACGPGGQ
jgi:hypothetical protein